MLMHVHIDRGYRLYSCTCLWKKKSVSRLSTKLRSVINDSSITSVIKTDAFKLSSNKLASRY